MRSEESPLVTANTSATVPEPPVVVATSRYVVTVLFLVCMYIGLSATLINYNKFLMAANVFPFPVALTWLHMSTSLIFSVALYAIFGKTLFPSMDAVCRRPHRYFGKILPIALCFGGSIILSNEAYVYCSVPFLQMCKELNIVLVYFLTLALALDKYNPRTAAILLAIMFGCSMGIEGELNYSRVGFLIQISAQVCEVFRIVVQQSVMQGQSVDPLSMVLLMSPLCVLAISTALYTFWTPEVIFQMQAHWGHLVLNCLTAYALNVIVATLIATCSGVAFVLAGVVSGAVHQLLLWRPFRRELARVWKLAG